MVNSQVITGGIFGDHYIDHRSAFINNKTEMSIGRKTSGYRYGGSANDAHRIVVNGKICNGFGIAIIEMQFRYCGVIYTTNVGIPGPGIEIVASLTPKHVVIALTGINTVNIVGQAHARTAIAPKLIIAAVTVNGVGTKTAVNTITGAGTAQDVIAGTAVQNANPVATALSKNSSIQSICPFNKTNGVVAAKTGNPELFNHGSSIRCTPGTEKNAVYDFFVKGRVTCVVNHHEIFAFLTIGKTEVNQAMDICFGEIGNGQRCCSAKTSGNKSDGLAPDNSLNLIVGLVGVGKLGFGRDFCIDCLNQRFKVTLASNSERNRNRIGIRACCQRQVKGLQKAVVGADYCKRVAGKQSYFL